MNGLEVEAGVGIVSLQADVSCAKSSPFAGVGVVRPQVLPGHDLPAIDPRSEVVFLSNQNNREKLICGSDNTSHRAQAEDGTGAEIGWLSGVRVFRLVAELEFVAVCGGFSGAGFSAEENTAVEFFTVDACGRFEGEVLEGLFGFKESGTSGNVEQAIANIKGGF